MKRLAAGLMGVGLLLAGLATPNMRPSGRLAEYLPWSYPALYMWGLQPESSEGREANLRLLSAGPPYTDWTLARLARRNPAQDLPFPVPERVEPLIRLAASHLDPDRGSWHQFNAHFLRRLAACKRPELAPVLLELAEDPATPRRQALLGLSLLGWESFEEGRLQVEGPHAERAQQLYARLAGKTPAPADPLPALWERLDTLRTPTQVAELVDPLPPAQRKRLLDEGHGRPESYGQWLFWEHSRDPHARVFLWWHGAGPVLPAFPDLNVLRGLDYWILPELAKAQPEGRLDQGCRDYAAVRGGPYFQDEFTFPVPGPPPGTTAGWRAWLARFPDHPGADDAAYWLGRNLEWEGRRAEALTWFVDLALHCPGDADMDWRIRDHLHWMLDVGVTAGDLDSWLTAHPGHSAHALLTYARALRDARGHRYAAALQRTAGLHLGGPLCDSLYWNDTSWSFAEPDVRLDEVHRERPSLDEELACQRSLWQSLPTEPYALGARWAAPDGWRLGYFLPLRGTRVDLWEYTWRDYVGDYQQRPDRGVLRAEAARANYNLVADELMARVGTEKALYMRVALRNFQATRAPEAESQALGRDWVAEARVATLTLLETFPHNRYGDDALLALYEIDQDPRWLERLRREFPDTDRSIPESNP